MERMPPPDALGPTAPQPARDPRGLQPSPPSAPRGLLAIVIIVALVVGLGIGVLIGRTTSIVTGVTAPSIELGHLGVVSKPADGNVVVDGRFVGVSPIDRLDLDPGKHSIVIDAFGYQPYAGTLEIESHGKLNLSVTLAPLGVEGPTTGTVAGAGTAKHAVVPPSALLPAGGAPAATEPARKAPPPRSPSAAPAPARMPSPPRRDCSGEQSRCHDSCSRAETDCRFSCPGCSSCLTSVGWDECKRQCDTCRSGCDQNVKFCESSCASQHASCEASQP
jgi:hypothetical protein